MIYLIIDRTPYAVKAARTVRACQKPAIWLGENGVTDERYFTFDAAFGTITDYDIAGGLDVAIPSEINGISVISIGDNAFYNKGLTSVIIPDGVITIGETAFSYNLLEEVIIPDNVITIGDSAFFRNLLQEVTFGSQVEIIDNYAFAGNLLQELVLPDSLNTIGRFAFVANEAPGENSITSIIIGSGVVIGDNMLSFGDNYFRDAYSGAGVYTGTQHGAWTKQ